MQETLTRVQIQEEKVGGISVIIQKEKVGGIGIM